MTPYLLSSQSALDIAKRLNLPAERWLEAAVSRGLYEDDICISAVVPMTVMHTIEMEIAAARSEKDPTLASLGKLKTNAQRFLAAFQQSDRIVAMDQQIASRWGDLLDMTITYADPNGVAYEIESAEKVELATASIGRDGRGFVYVERRQSAHRTIPDLVVECPYEFTAALDAK
ncbi:hypothetical protein [Nitratireductor sp. XY-223]|uniref:hypothetical protein n=1 Tax=Nitratireductor sp. XY-223 TaxID=2561926 RepID=UPI0010A9B462|nr:hypothetical protein [Nitratireductor sp. XY-223]